MKDRTSQPFPDLDQFGGVDHSGPSSGVNSSTCVCDAGEQEKRVQTGPTLQNPSSNPSNGPHDSATSTALLRRCKELGITLWVEDGRLKYSAPRGTFDSLRTELVDCKHEL